MFNRNLNGRQFPDLDLGAPAVPQPGGSAPTHAKGESIPFAGGTFNVAENMMNEGGYRVDKGAWISQSTQTVLPGSLSHGTEAEGAYAEFNSWPEQQATAEGADPDQHIGIVENDRGKGTSRWGAGQASLAVGYTEMEPVAFEDVGGAIRDLRRNAAGRHEKREARGEPDGRRGAL